MGGATFTTLWHMKQTAATGARYDRFLRRDGPIGVLNEDEIRRAQRASYSETLKNGNDIALPPGFPAPQLALPEDGFAPDYFLPAHMHSVPKSCEMSWRSPRMSFSSRR